MCCSLPHSCVVACSCGCAIATYHMREQASVRREVGASEIQCAVTMRVQNTFRAMQVFCGSRGQ